MTNNFAHIKSLLKFEEDYFYFIQIIQRKKEVPDLGSNNRVLRSYMASSMDKLERSEKEIIDLCEAHNARAYIHLNRRKWSKISIEQLRHIAELIANGQHESVKTSLETVIGRTNCEPKDSKTWIVDVDDTFIPSPMMMATISYDCEPKAKSLEEGKILAVIPTKNGHHLITKPFDRSEFHIKYPTTDVHTDNPTILYVA